MRGTEQQKERQPLSRRETNAVVAVPVVVFVRRKRHKAARIQCIPTGSSCPRGAGLRASAVQGGAQSAKDGDSAIRRWQSSEAPHHQPETRSGGVP